MLGVNSDLESIYTRLIHLLEWGVVKALRHIFGVSKTQIKT